MTEVVVVASVAAATVCVLVGAASAFGARDARKRLIDAIEPRLEPATKEDVPPAVQDQSIASALDGLSKVAGALKDLDRVAQMFTLALGFLAIAAVAAGVDAVADATGS